MCRVFLVWLMTANGRKRTFVFVEFGVSERPLLGKADISSSSNGSAISRSITDDSGEYLCGKQVLCRKRCHTQTVALINASITWHLRVGQMWGSEKFPQNFRSHRARPHIANVCFHRKRPFKSLDIGKIEGLLTAKSGRSRLLMVSALAIPRVLSKKRHA
jgi:hypothetical protein